MFFRDRHSVLTPQVLQEMIGEYYDAMGWDGNGRPLPSTLAALGIETGLSMPGDDRSATQGYRC